MTDGIQQTFNSYAKEQGNHPHCPKVITSNSICAQESEAVSNRYCSINLLIDHVPVLKTMKRQD